MILGRKVNLFKNDDMAEFVFECSMFVIMNRYNDSYILPEKSIIVLLSKIMLNFWQM